MTKSTVDVVVRVGHIIEADFKMLNKLVLAKSTCLWRQAWSDERKI